MDKAVYIIIFKISVNVTGGFGLALFTTGVLGAAGVSTEVAVELICNYSLFCISYY
jgi:hypothetical protein